MANKKTGKVYSKKELGEALKEMVEVMALEEGGKPVQPSGDMGKLIAQIVEAAEVVTEDDEFSASTADVIEWVLDENVRMEEEEIAEEEKVAEEKVKEEIEEKVKEIPVVAAKKKSKIKKEKNTFYSRSTAIGAILATLSKQTITLEQLAILSDKKFVEITNKNSNVKECMGRLRSIVDCLEGMGIVIRIDTHTIQIQ